MDVTRSTFDLEIFPTSESLVVAAAERFVAASAEALRVSGRFAVALSGGSTPIALYEQLAVDPYPSRVNWAHVHVFWGDERCVPPETKESNYRMARAALLDLVPLPTKNLHRIRGEDEPAAAALAYENELRVFFETPIGAPKIDVGSRFDLVLLGMGEDGHTASLFPGSQALRPETHRWAMAGRSADAMWRVTLTPLVINAAAEIVFLVCGGNKAATLSRVLAGSPRRNALPAQRIAPRAGHLRWLVDADAATDLAETRRP